jgi:hypothetical protein
MALATRLAAASVASASAKMPDDMGDPGRPVFTRARPWDRVAAPVAGLSAVATRRPVVAALWLIAALAAATQVVRLGIFIVDPRRASASILPTNQFFREHSCLTSFTEAARLAGEPGVNVYDPLVYVAPGCTDLLTCGDRWIGWEDVEPHRLREAQLWLALLNLGSFRSPFVPDAYALMGTTWLLTPIAAERSSATAWRVLFLSAVGVMFALIFDRIWVTEPPRRVVLVTRVNQLLALGLNGWVLARAILPQPVAAGAAVRV